MMLSVALSTCTLTNKHAAAQKFTLCDCSARLVLKVFLVQTEADEILLFLPFH